MTFYFIFLNNLEDKISNNIHRGTKRPDSSIYMLLLRYFLIYTINNIKIHKTCFNCTYFLNQTYLMSYLYVLLNISMLMMNFGSQNENEKENTCSLLHKTFAGKNLPKITINVTFFFVCFLVENTEFLRNALKPKHIVKAFKNSKSWLLLPGLCRFNFQLILPLSCSRLSVPRATFMVVSLRACRNASIRGTEVSQESRPKVAARVERCHTRAPLWPGRCRTWESQRRALRLRETGRGSGCRTLGGTVSSGCCLSPRSATWESGASYSQTTGWCTDCRETWTETVLITSYKDALEMVLMPK